MSSGEQEDNRIDETLQKLRDAMSEKMNLYGDIQNEFGILANEISQEFKL
jgi:hypothetical protein